MGPSKALELQIAREMDKHSERDELRADAVPAILAFLDFKLSSSDYEFLKCYVEWRIANPIAK